MFRVLAIDPLDTNRLYAGTDGGVLASRDAGASWHTLNNGVPCLETTRGRTTTCLTSISALALDPVSSGRLYASVTPYGVFDIEQIGAPTCIGDCHSDGKVTIDELVVMVKIALGEALPTACEPGDHNGDSRITVDELVAAVNNALNGCP